MVKQLGFVVVVLPVILACVGCAAPSQPNTAVIQTEVAKAIAVERTAMALTPTATAYPTYTPQPTWTLPPTATATSTSTPEPTATSTITPTSTPDLETLVAMATEAVPYEELLRNTEAYIGQVMTWRGAVEQTIEVDAQHAILRIAVTEGRYGWSDTLWVDYEGPRVIVDDVVLLTGRVIGRRSYQAVLGNQITIPEVEPLDLVLETKVLPTRAPVAPQPTSIPIPKVVPLRQEFQGQHFAWNLYDVKRRKAVYHYNNATIAQGTYLLVFVEFRNTSSGTAYPDDEPTIAVFDGHGNVYSVTNSSWEATWASRWQFQCGTIHTKMNPGEVLGVVTTWDMPGGVGDLYLRIGEQRIYLGDFDAMAVEDQ